MGSPIRLEFNCSKCKASNTLHSGCTPRINEDRMEYAPFEVVRNSRGFMDNRFTFRCTECEFPNLFQGTKEEGYAPVPSVPTQTPAITPQMEMVIQAVITNTLWHGSMPCSQCGGTLHSKWEPSAAMWVCAGCYNEFALEMGWERKPLSTQEKAIKYDGLIAELKRIKATSSIGNFIDMASDLVETFS